MTTEKMLEYLILSEVLDTTPGQGLIFTGNRLTQEQFMTLHNKYQELRTEFTHEQLHLTQTTDPVKDITD